MVLKLPFSIWWVVILCVADCGKLALDRLGDRECKGQEWGLSGQAAFVVEPALGLWSEPIVRQKKISRVIEFRSQNRCAV